MPGIIWVTRIPMMSRRVDGNRKRDRAWAAGVAMRISTTVAPDATMMLVSTSFFSLAKAKRYEEKLRWNGNHVVWAAVTPDCSEALTIQYTGNRNTAKMASAIAVVIQVRRPDRLIGRSRQ